jgi:small subunit ribosomal protein S1
MSEATATDAEKQTWPEIVTRRMQERPDDASGFRASLVGLRDGLLWEKRQVKATRGGSRGPQITEAETEAALKAASAVEFGIDPEEENRLDELYERTIQAIKEGEIVQGKVLAATKDEVIVDVGFKSEGVISRSEFPHDAEINAGDPVEVFLEAVEDQNGQLVLSKQKADFMRVWDRIKEAYEEKQLVRGRLVRRIKGGVVVDLFGAEAFLPGSQIALRQVSDFDNLISTEMEFKIIKLNKNRRNLVVSRRVVLEEERNRLRDTLLQEIEVGQVREGIVKNVTDFGVFVDLGGVDGLLHITDMSWGRVVHPSEITKVGDTINVKVLDYNSETTRISLGLKQLEPYPWDNIEARYPIGTRVNGRIVSVTDYGAFIELEKGIEGLIHVSEMSWTQHVKHPSKVVKPGDVVEAVVLNIDKSNEKISLGIKQLEPDPWSVVDINFPVGNEVEGKVRNLTAFGAFVELDEGIDGLVHISDMSWTKRLQHPNEMVKKGDGLRVKILSIDKDNRRISLGIKQLSEDPWPTFPMIYPVGSDREAVAITRLMERGVVVEIDPDIEAFVPIQYLGVPDLKKPEDAFKPGDTVPIRMIEVDKASRKIVASVSDFLKAREEDEMSEYLAAHPISTVKLGEAAGADMSETTPDTPSGTDDVSTTPDTPSDTDDVPATPDAKSSPETDDEDTVVLTPEASAGTTDPEATDTKEEGSV